MGGGGQGPPDKSVRAFDDWPASLGRTTTGRPCLCALLLSASLALSYSRPAVPSWVSISIREKAPPPPPPLLRLVEFASCSAQLRLSSFPTPTPPPPPPPLAPQPLRTPTPKTFFRRFLPHMHKPWLQFPHFTRATQRAPDLCFPAHSFHRLFDPLWSRLYAWTRCARL